MENEIPHSSSQKNALGKTIVLFIFYVSSFSIFLLSNKALADQCGHFWQILAVLIWQSLVNIFFAKVGGILGLIPAPKEITKRKISQILFSPLLIALVFISAMQSLRYLSVPTYLAFRNFSTIVLGLGYWILFAYPISREILIIFFLMLISSIIAGANEFLDNLPGSSWSFFHLIFSVIYLLYIKSVVKKTKFSHMNLNYYNNALCLPILLALTILTFSFSSSPHLFYLPYSSSFTSLLLINAIASFLFSLTSFWALRNKTASQFSAFFTLSKIPLAFFSTKLFPVSMSFLSVCGIVFAFLTATIYVHTKNAYREKQLKKLRKKVKIRYAPNVGMNRTESDSNFALTRSLYSSSNLLIQTV